MSIENHLQQDQEPTIVQLFLLWTNATNYREERRFLEDHLELIRPENMTILVTYLSKSVQEPEKLFLYAQYIELLADTYQRGGTIASIHEAYINKYGGFVLDLPDWLIQACLQFDRYRESENIEETLFYLSLLRQTLTQTQQATNLAPEIQAELQYNLGLALSDYPEERIQAYLTALQVYTQERYPLQYATTQFSLGTAYTQNTRENAKDSWEQAIACYSSALQVFTSDRFPEDWISSQNNLGNAYCERIAGERRNNIEQALSCFRAIVETFTREQAPSGYTLAKIYMGNAYCERIAGKRPNNLERALACFQDALSGISATSFPVEYAMGQVGMGNAYQERIFGKKLKNIELAIKCYKRALRIFTHKQSPDHYGKIQNSLGNAYRERITGEKRKNFEIAIACYQKVLQIFTIDRVPDQWMVGMNNLGIVYCERIEGIRRENLEMAIACHEAVLKVCTPDTFQSEYARTQCSLGNAYRERINGKKLDNIEMAVDCYHKGLQIYTEASFPWEYAMAQNGLGNTYFERLASDRSQNLELAIACHQAALRIYTPTSSPIEYSISQSGLGNAYFERIAEDKRQNLELAIACHRAALKVCTRKDFSFEYARHKHNLGVVYRERIAGERRDNLEYALSCLEEALQIFTPEDFPVDYPQAQNNLGNAYRLRITGEKYKNQEQALLCYERALQIYKSDEFPADYAIVQHNLGDSYNERIKGEKRINLEQAIEYYERALQIRTLEDFSTDYALTQNNLGAAYAERIEGNRANNLEQAINRYQEALKIYTRKDFQKNYAMTQHNLGTAYLLRIQGSRRQNIETAIDCYQNALAIYNHRDFPQNYAFLQNDLGTIYNSRIAGEKSANGEESIRCHLQALEVFTYTSFPVEYAMTQLNLGNAYRDRLIGERSGNLEQALTCYQASLLVYTLDAFPGEHRLAQIHCAETELQRKNWENAHTAYEEAYKAEDLLVTLSTGTMGRDAILKDGRDASIRDGFVLLHLQRIADAAIAIERGRARGLSEARSIANTDPRSIQDEQRRGEYERARENFIYAQKALHASALPQMLRTSVPPPLNESERRAISLERSRSYQDAKERFYAMITEIRNAQDPADFSQDLLDTSALLDLIKKGNPDHTLVYLIATPQGGAAIAIFSANSVRATPAYFDMLALPDLTDTLVRSLAEVRLPDDFQHIVGGFIQAQEAAGLKLLTGQGWSGITLREKATAFCAASEMLHQDCTLASSIQELLSTDELKEHVDMSLETLTKEELNLLETTLNHSFLQRELARCLPKLREVAISPLITWLQKQGTTNLTLIPCGLLAVFPLIATPLLDGRTVGETLPTSIAPNVRSMTQSSESISKRSGIFALGNPHPTQQELEWGEAEAHTIAALARHIGLKGQAKVQKQATLPWLRGALEEGYVVDISCHGSFHVDDFLQSALLLAGGQRLYLGNMLSHEIDLRGLRLLILSGCQTAISDPRGARDEVHSLAIGMFQAGARAVLGSLWSVDDKATYLLMVRFAQEWLPNMHTISPASALAEAQRWLRTRTNKQLREWQAIQQSKPGLVEKRETEAENPQMSTWQQETLNRDTQGPLLAVRGQGNRYDLSFAENLVRTNEIIQEDLEKYPYENPIYWAGFQITGW